MFIKAWFSHCGLRPPSPDPEAFTGGITAIDRKIASLLLPLALLTLRCAAQNFTEAESSSSTAPAPSTPLAAASPAPAQRSDRSYGPEYSYFPHPQIEGGLSLMEGGYAPAAANIGAGLNIEASRFIATVSATTDNAHKLDSDSGHDAYAQARGFFRMNNYWFIGGGLQWNNLSTDVYSKYAWHPAFGGGKDFFRENFSFRTQVVYVLPGTDHLNASQGPEISLWLPSPASQRHFFYHQTLGIYEAHQTSTPIDPGTSDRFVSLYAGFNLMYRF